MPLTGSNQPTSQSRVPQIERLVEEKEEEEVVVVGGLIDNSCFLNVFSHTQQKRRRSPTMAHSVTL